MCVGGGGGGGGDTRTDTEQKIIREGQACLCNVVLCSVA